MFFKLIVNKVNKKLMNILREEMIKYAGIIKEDIGTDRILTCFRKFYKGNSNALNDATFGNVC